MGIKDNVITKNLPVDYISKTLTLNVGEAIEIPVEQRKKLLAALHYYTKRKGSHEGFRYRTKKSKDGFIYVMREPCC